VTQGDLIGILAGEAAAEAVRQVRLGELSSLGQVETFIQDAISRWLDKYGAQFGAKLSEIAEPAAQKAVETIKPSVYQALNDYTPTFAVIAGGMMGLSVLLGVWIGRGKK